MFISDDRDVICDDDVNDDDNVVEMRTKIMMMMMMMMVMMMMMMINMKMKMKMNTTMMVVMQR